MGQHVPGPLNHLSGGVITALWDATQPSNTQGALQRRHLLRKHSERGSCRREGQAPRERFWGWGGGWGWRRFGMPFGKLEVNLLNIGWQSNIAEWECVWKGRGGRGWWAEFSPVRTSVFLSWACRLLEAVTNCWSRARREICSNWYTEVISDAHSQSTWWFYSALLIYRLDINLN